MTKQTLQQQYIAALQQRGFTIVPDGSSRYTLLHREAPSTSNPGVTTHAYMWVGANGAVRFNNVKRVDGSRSMSDGWKAKLIAKN